MKLKVDNIVENPDGTATVNFEVDDEMELHIAQQYGVTVEELTVEQVKEFVMKAISGLAEDEQKDLQQP